jgi:pimeloyl-ACP methyl ester carboxylesterase
MINFKNNISLFDSTAIFLLSISNEGETDGDIEGMGRRLAHEVEMFIEEYCPGNALARINVVAHSLGGLIARAALPHLEAFAHFFDKFLTLSSPHLG